MTSSALRDNHDDWFLDALRRAGDEDCPPLGPDRLHDIVEARRMTPGERLAALNEIMLLVETAGVPLRVEQAVECSRLQL
jgi:hypothetical protein